MTRKLNGWERLGVVLSAGYLVFLSIVAFQIFQSASPSSYHDFVEWYDPTNKTSVKFIGRRAESACEKQCREIKDDDKRLDCFLDCPAVEEKLEKRFDWSSFVLALFLPLLASWAGGYGAVWLVKWVIAGFKGK